MSKSVNPLLIGSFTVGALLLLIVGIFIFGGSQLFNKDRVRFVIYFDSSLNGLEIGAPVKMQGVKIGEVTEIALQLDPQTDKIFKPVVIEIDTHTLTDTDGNPLRKGETLEERLNNRDKLVAAGFRARLETQSLLTGLLYVDLDLHPDEQPLLVDAEYKGLVELPSIPTTTEEIRNILVDAAKKIQQLPLEQIVNDLAGSLKEIRELLGSDDIKTSRVALAHALAELERALKTINKNLDPMLKNADRTIVNANALIQDLRRDIKPVLTSTNDALVATERSMNKVGDAVGPESALTDTLQALRDATRSIIELTDYLERHPESLISGKQQ